jgi:hypothetical protein
MGLLGVGFSTVRSLQQSSSGQVSPPLGPRAISISIPRLTLLSPASCRPWDRRSSVGPRARWRCGIRTQDGAGAGNGRGVDALAPWDFRGSVGPRRGVSGRRSRVVVGRAGPAQVVPGHQCRRGAGLPMGGCRPGSGRGGRRRRRWRIVETGADEGVELGANQIGVAADEFDERFVEPTVPFRGQRGVRLSYGVAGHADHLPPHPVLWARADVTNRQVSR